MCPCWGTIQRFSWNVTNVSHWRFLIKKAGDQIISKIFQRP
jgi:hypothetical protein